MNIRTFVLNDYYMQCIDAAAKNSSSFLALVELMDARILHHIYQKQISQDHANAIVVCAGCLHTWNIETKLRELGYTQIYKKGVSSLKDINQDASLSGSIRELLRNVPSKLQAKL